MKVPHQDIQLLLTDAFRRGARIRMTATGTSMQPWIRGDDLVELEAIDSARICVGDVVLARRPDATHLIHRVVHVEDERVLLRGDAQNGPEPFQRHDIMARVVSVQRGKRVFDLDRGMWPILGLLWVLFPPLGVTLYDCLSAARRMTRQLFARL